MDQTKTDVETPPASVLEHLVKCRAFVAALAAADALILVLADNLEPTSLGKRGEDNSLVLGSLTIATDPKIKRCPCCLRHACHPRCEGGLLALLHAKFKWFLHRSVVVARDAEIRRSETGYADWFSA